MKKIRSILLLHSFAEHLPGSDLMSFQRLRFFTTTTLFSVLIFAGTLYQMSIANTNDPFFTGLTSFLFMAVFVNYFGLAVHKNSSIAYIILMFLTFALLHITSYSAGGIRSSGIFYLAALILIAFMLMGKTGGIVMSAFSTINIIYFYFISRYTNWVDYSLIGTGPEMLDFDFLITGALSVLFVTAQAGYIEKSKNAIIEDIRVKRDELAVNNTLLMKAQEDLQIINKAILQKNKELEQFVYIASHDLQEPLCTTTSFVQLIQRQYKGKLDEKADKYFNLIVDASDRMKTLIKDLLDYSLIGSKKAFKKIDCNSILKDVLADLGNAIKEAQAEIKVEKLSFINGYDIEIKQLFQNLIINAIKFRKKDVAPQIIISVQKNNDCWEFLVKDNGIGIDEQHKDRIFVIFQRLHPRTVYEGSGIGLSHCKKIVEQHGGKIWIESKPGEGTTFHFTIQKKIGLEKENELSVAC